MHPFDIYFPQPAPRPEPTPELAQYALDRMNAGSFPLPGGTMPYEQMVRAQQLANGPTPPTPTQKQEPAKQKGGLTVLPTQEPDQRAKRLSKDLDRQVRQLNTIAATLPPDLQQHAQTSYQLAQQAIEQNDFATAEEIINELNPARLRNVARARYEGPARRARVQARRLGGAARPQMPVDPMAMMGGAMGGASFRPDLMGLRPGKDGAGNVTMTPGGLSPYQQQVLSRRGQREDHGITPYQKALLAARAEELRERKRQFDEQMYGNQEGRQARAEAKDREAKQERRDDLNKELLDLAKQYEENPAFRPLIARRMREIQNELGITAEDFGQKPAPPGEQPGKQAEAMPFGMAPPPKSEPKLKVESEALKQFAEPGMSSMMTKALEKLDEIAVTPGASKMNPLNWFTPQAEELMGGYVNLRGIQGLLMELQSQVSNMNEADKKVLLKMQNLYRQLGSEETKNREGAPLTGGVGGGPPLKPYTYGPGVSPEFDQMFKEVWSR